ncbi:MAG TPA: hypothetical protein VI818_08000 [Candidatus Thermoplasmatota archaeon]|nr:hypothetical protein [Candidatus Thermoplasmatota archaeon]
MELAQVVAFSELAVGAVFWALGFRVFRLFVLMTGLAAGALAGFLLGGWVDDAPATLWVAAAGAFGGVLLAWRLQRVFVFVGGAALGSGPSYLALEYARIDGVVGATTALVAGVLVGAAALRFHKLFVIALTSMGGGVALVVGAFGLAGRNVFTSSEAALFQAILLGLLVGVSGMPVQYALLARRPKAPPALTESDADDPGPHVPGAVRVGVLLPVGERQTPIRPARP